MFRRRFRFTGKRRPTEGPEAPDYRRRDQRFIQLAHQHVVTTKHLWQTGEFSSPQAFHRRLKKLRVQGLLRLVGTVLLNACGRPLDCYSNSWTPPLRLLRHEALLTDFLLLYPQATTIRGKFVNRRIRPDAEIQFSNNQPRRFVEFDTGSISLQEIERGQRRRYRGVNDLVLYVTLTEERLEDLIRHSKYIRDIALFTTLERAKADPHGKIWRACDGSIAHIPK